MNRDSVFSLKTDTEWIDAFTTFSYSAYVMYVNNIAYCFKGYSCEEIVEVLDMMPWVCNETKT